jgi:hypothetical protein
MQLLAFRNFSVPMEDEDRFLTMKYFQNKNVITHVTRNRRRLLGCSSRKGYNGGEGRRMGELTMKLERVNSNGTD